MIELILLAAAAATVVVLLLAVLSVGWELRKGRTALVDLAAAVETGAQPASLHPKIDLGQCLGSGSCVTACPETDVLAILHGQAHVVNPTSCIGHGECMAACPVDAITLVLGTARRGVEIPMVGKDFETNVPGIYVVGELGGMGLIYNATTQALQCMDALVAGLPAKREGVKQLVIVGAGPAGIAASLAAMKANLDFVTVDQDSLGGTVLQYPRHKVVMTKPVVLPLYGRLKIGELSKEALLEIWEDVLRKTGLTIRSHTRVEGIEHDEGGDLVVCLPEGERVSTQRVVLAMGRRGTPRKLGVPGEELAKVVYRLLDPERYEARDCLVVGGGDSALEAAIALSEVGARVTLSYRKPKFTRAKRKNRERIQAKIEAQRVRFLPSSSVRSIEAGAVTVSTAGEESRLDNAFVLIFAGGLLPTQFLADAGVSVERFTGQAYAPANPGQAPSSSSKPVVRPPEKVDELQLHECVGRGAFGEVYRASLQRGSGSEIVAIKVLHRNLDRDSDAIHRLRDEATLLAMLDHPVIVKAQDLVVLDGRIALVMEYVEGLNLGQICRRTLPPERAAVEIAAAVASALHGAWTTLGPSGQPMRLVHRDVKPSNVQVGSNGVVKLLDFGVARADVAREASTATGLLVGTYPYMAPESFKGPAGAPGDVYALGCLLFEITAGRRYLKGKSLPEHYAIAHDRELFETARTKELARLEDHVHPLTANLIQRAIAWSAEERPSTDDLMTLFRQLLGRVTGDSLEVWASALSMERTLEDGEMSGGRYPLSGPEAVPPP